MNTTSPISRRSFVGGSASLAGLVVTGCATQDLSSAGQPPTTGSGTYAKMYGPMPNERFPIPAIDLRRVPTKYYRQRVDYPTIEPVGSLIVDTSNFYLYLVRRNGKAIRYGVGLGRAGFEWSGRARVGWKRKWPKWTPPADMIAREPHLAKYSVENGGMPPGLNNPLGARALYIFQGRKDTLYRVHGSSEYWTIGKAVSSGCVRLMNQDVIDLYRRVPTGSPILVT